jgi:hypothetical protein
MILLLIEKHRNVKDKDKIFFLNNMQDKINEIFQRNQGFFLSLGKLYKNDQDLLSRMSRL